MAKCIRCGRGGMGVLHQAVKLKDKNLICFKCYKELGGEPLKDMTTAPLTYTYDDIKDGFDAYYSRRKKARIEQAVRESVSVKFTGGERDLVCTEEEREVFEMVRAICNDDNIKLIRRSDNYVSAVMPSSKGCGDMDLARIKFTNRAKWIMLAPEFNKVELSAPEDVKKLVVAIRAAYRFNEPYL